MDILCNFGLSTEIGAIFGEQRANCNAGAACRPGVVARGAHRQLQNCYSRWLTAPGVPVNLSRGDNVVDTAVRAKLPAWARFPVKRVK